MYYLQSRYYDPAIGRFINADVFATTDAEGFLSCNMFAYCENDPINKSDPSGEFPWNMVVGGAINLATSYAAAKLTGQSFSAKDAVVSFAVGAINYSGLGSVARIASSAISAIHTAGSSYTHGATWYGALATGVLSGGLNYFSMSSLSGLDAKAFSGYAGMAAMDLTFGFGSNIVSATSVYAATKNNQKATSSIKPSSHNSTRSSLGKNYIRRMLV